jgi:hypothetical protein
VIWKNGNVVVRLSRGFSARRDLNDWWRCDPWALPDNAAAKITEMESDCLGIKVRFSRPKAHQLREEMEQFIAEYAIEVPSDLPPLFTRPPDKEEQAPNSHRVEKRDKIAVRSSNGRSCFSFVVPVSRTVAIAARGLFGPAPRAANRFHSTHGREGPPSRAFIFLAVVLAAHSRDFASSRRKLRPVPGKKQNPVQPNRG